MGPERHAAPGWISCSMLDCGAASRLHHASSIALPREDLPAQGQESTADFSRLESVVQVLTSRDFFERHCALRRQRTAMTREDLKSTNASLPEQKTGPVWIFPPSQNGIGNFGARFVLHSALHGSLVLWTSDRLVRPISVLRFWISEGLTQAES